MKISNLKKSFTLFIIFIIWTLSCFVGGYTYHIFYGEKPKPKIVYKEKVKYKIIQRNYAKLPQKFKDNELFKYDTSPFKLDIEPYEGTDTNYRITGQLYKRKASRDVRIECGSNNSFKFYVGVGVVAAAAGYGIYRLVK